MRRLNAACLLALLLWGAGIVPVAAQGVADVSIMAPHLVNVGTNFTANVSVSSVTNFDAANYDISFDPSVLRLESVADGNIGGKHVPIDTWNQRETGRYTIVQNLPGLSGTSGTGVLSILRFQVIGAIGQGTAIRLLNGVLGDTEGREIPSTWTGAVPRSASLPPPPTANFTISNLKVVPGEVKPSDLVTISVLVTNTGGSAGNHTVSLKLGGIKEAEEQISLGAGQLRTVSFLVSGGAAGSYAIDVNGQTGGFVVLAPPASTSPPAATNPPPESPITPPQLSAPVEMNPPQQTPISPAEANPSSQVTVDDTAQHNTAASAGHVTSGSAEIAQESAKNPALLPPNGINWRLIGGGVGGAVILGGLIVFLLTWRAH